MTEPTRRMTRRSFLAAAGSTLAAGLGLPYALRRSFAAPASIPPAIDPLPDDPEWSFVQPRPARLDLWGRITDPGSPVHLNPKPGDIIGFVHQHKVFPILEMVEGEGKNPNNRLWYRIEPGWVYTQNIQAIHPYRMPDEVREIDTQIRNVLDELIPGFWGEIVVPFTTARTEPSGASATLIDDSPMVLYYGSVFRVVEARPDNAGFLWYKVIDDRKETEPYWVLARHMRRIPPRELEPINPGANKRVEVNLERQQIDCYEDDRLVFTTLTSSGGDGFDTPAGEHAVVYKQPSRHMYDDPENAVNGDPNYFDLPGVPFNVFFTTMGHAIHGTHWHGDFGRPRSHGCLNVTPEAARWIFRWVEPISPYEAIAHGSSAAPGTPVIVT